jgi:hypothetical protein
MVLPIDPMDYLKGAKAAGVTIYGCGVAALLSGIIKNCRQRYNCLMIKI